MEKYKDLFISYSSKDKDFVKKLAEDLTSYGVKVWWDQWEMKVGDSLNKKIQEGISQSSWLGIVLSPDSVKSPWVERELNSALIKELQLHDVFVLPILYRACDIPIFLQDKVYADFKTSYEKGLQILLDRISRYVDPRILKGLLSKNSTKILSCYSKIPHKKKEMYHNIIIDKLLNSSGREKLALLECLYIIRYKGLSSLLLSLVNDSSITIPRQALFYMGKLKSKEFIPTVSIFLSNKSPDIRAAARDAYKKITGSRA